MICSILIPTRKRVERLRRCIQSFADTATPGNYEVVLAVDDDDTETLNALPWLPVVRQMISKRRGWADLEGYFDEMSQMAEAPWLCITNDDITFEGRGWDKQLESLPTTGVIAQPEIMRLGGSKYPRCGWTCSPFVPKGCWQSFGVPCPKPADLMLHVLLVKQHGWKTVYLKGLTANHQRDSDAELAKHRL